MSPARVMIDGRECWFWCRSPNKDAPGRVPDSVFDRLADYLPLPDAAPYYSGGTVARRYYPSAAAALAAVRAAS